MKPVFRLNDEQMTATTPEFYHSMSRKSSTPSHHNNFEPSPQPVKRESPRNFAYSPRYRPDLAKYIPQSNGPSETPYEKRTMQISNNFTPRNIGFASTISAFYNPAEHKEERGSSVEPWRTTTQNPQSSPRTMVTSPLAKSMFFNKDDDTNILTRKKYDDNMNSTPGFRSTPDNLNIPSFRKTAEVKEKSDDNTSPKKSTITYYHIDEFINKYKNMNTPRETREVERKDPSPRALSSNRLAPHSTPKNVVNIMRNSFYAESPNSQQSPPTFKKQNNLHQDVAKNSHETSPRFQRLLNNAHTFEYKKAEQKDLTELTTSLNQPILTRSFSNFKRDIDKHLEATPSKKTVTEKTERTTPRNSSVNPSRVEPSEEKVSLDSFVTKVDRGATFSSNFSSKLEKKNDLKTNEKENISASYNETKVLTRTMPSFRDSPFKASHTILNNSQIFKQLEKTAATEPGFNSQYSEYAKLNIRNSTRTSTSRNDDSTDSSQEDEPRRTRSPPTYYMNNLRRHLVNFREGDYLNEIYREHFKQTFESLKFSKYMRPNDTRSLSEKRVFLTRKETYRFKKTLIFDMDETLIHCNEGKNVPSDVKIPIKLPQGGMMEAGINIRPYARECLKELSQYFEVIVFTASHKTYANAVLDYLDPKKQFIQHRLFRDSCIYTDERVYVKDLRILGNRNLQDVILVDNAAYSFGFQVENGVPIIPFYDDKNDQELKHLTTYLKSLCNVKDVREVNKKTFKLHLYANYDTPQEVIENVVLMN